MQLELNFAFEEEEVVGTLNTVGDLWQVAIKGRQEGQDCLNILHFQTVQGNSSLETLLLQAIMTCWTSLIPVFRSDYQFDGLICKQVKPVLGPLIELQPAANQANEGAATGDGGISFASCLVSIRTTRGGRSGRGRMFIGGIPESATVGSSFNGDDPYFQAIVAFCTCMAAQFIFASDPLPGNKYFQLGVVSRKIGGAKPPFVGDCFAPATSLTPNLLVKSTVSRKVGRGS